MFRPISGHYQVHNWPLIHNEEEKYVVYVHKNSAKIIKI